MTLAGLRQQASGIDVNDLLAPASNDDAVTRLAGFMTKDQIKAMSEMLERVGRKIEEQPECASAQRGRNLDDDMDAILAGGSGSGKTGADEDEPQAKRQKTMVETVADEDDEL